MFWNLFKKDNKKKTAAEYVADGNKLLFDGWLDTLASSGEYQIYNVVPYESFKVKTDKNIIHVNVVPSKTDVRDNVTVFTDKTGTVALTDFSALMTYNGDTFETNLTTIKLITLLGKKNIKRVMKEKEHFKAENLDVYNY